MIDFGSELKNWAMDMMERKVFSSDFEALLRKMADCGELVKDFHYSVERGEDLAMPFTRLRARIQELIYMFSNTFKKYAEEDNEKEAITEDLVNFTSYLFSEDVGRYLSNAVVKSRGDLINIVSQMEHFLSYLKIVFDSIINEVNKTTIQKFREHALRNAGLIPKFKEMREAAKKMGVE